MRVDIARRGLSHDLVASVRIADRSPERAWEALRHVMMGNGAGIIRGVTKSEVETTHADGSINLYQEARWNHGFIRGTSKLLTHVTVARACARQSPSPSLRPACG